MKHSEKQVSLEWSNEPAYVNGASCTIFHCNEDHALQLTRDDILSILHTMEELREFEE